MKFYFLNAVNKLTQYSKKLDNLSLLQNNHWVLFDNETREKKIVYIFRQQNELLISVNGKLTKEKWEFLGNNSLIISVNDNNYLFKNGFIDEDILALKIDGQENFVVFINETNSKAELNSIEAIEKFLINKYLQNKDLSNKHKNKNIFDYSTTDLYLKNKSNLSDYEIWKADYLSLDRAHKFLSNNELYSIYERQVQNSLNFNESSNFPSYPIWKKEMIKKDIAYKYFSETELLSDYNKQRKSFIK